MPSDGSNSRRFNFGGFHSGGGVALDEEGLFGSNRVLDKRRLFKSSLVLH